MRGRVTNYINTVATDVIIGILLRYRTILEQTENEKMKHLQEEHETQH